MGQITAGATVNNTSGTTGQGSWNLTTANVGDLFVYFGTIGSGTGPSVSGLSSTHVTGWTNIGSTLTDATSGDTANAWIGVVNAAATAAVTATFSASIGAAELQSTGVFLHSPFGPQAQWLVLAHTETDVTTASTTINYPTFTPDNPSGTGVGYVGMAAVQGGATVGSTSGFSYLIDGFSGCLCYNPNGVGGTQFAPTATMTSGRTLNFGMMIAVRPLPIVPNNKQAIRRSSLF